MTKLLLGKPVQEKIIESLQAAASDSASAPCLAIIQVGNNPRSTVYINAKKRFAEKVGAKVRHIHIEESVGQDMVLNFIKDCNEDSEIHGIIVQLPLPEGYSKELILGSISPSKDVDGLTSGSKFIPATALAIKHLLDFYEIPVSGKKVVVMGRSDLVGKPTAELLTKAGGVVEVVHSKTDNPQTVTTQADILVVAIGKPEFVGRSYLKEGQIVVDVGIHEASAGGLVGDVSRKDAEGLVGALSPVPGGVGPLTVASLFENVFAARRNLLY